MLYLYIISFHFAMLLLLWESQFPLACTPNTSKCQSLAILVAFLFSRHFPQARRKIASTHYLDLWWKNYIYQLGGVLFNMYGSFKLMVCLVYEFILSSILFISICTALEGRKSFNNLFLLYNKVLQYWKCIGKCAKYRKLTSVKHRNHMSEVPEVGKNEYVFSLLR